MSFKYSVVLQRKNMKKEDKISLQGQTIEINGRIYSLIELQKPLKLLVPSMLKLTIGLKKTKLGTRVTI